MRSIRGPGDWCRRPPIFRVSVRTALPPSHSASPHGRTSRGRLGCCHAKSPVVPPGSTPHGRFQGVPPIDNVAPRDHAAQVCGAECGEFRPFGEQRHDVCTLSCLDRSRGVAEFRACPARAGNRRRIVHGDLCSHPGQDLRHIQGRGVQHIIGAGLECGTEHTDGHARKVALVGAKGSATVR